MFQPYQQADPPAVDEWTLHTHLRNDNAFDKLEDHYKTFIVSLYWNLILRSAANVFLKTEKDFAEIAASGLNYVRIPLPFWAIETRDGEPFLPKVAWT
jgi:glucan 1,3-beta-glucosidase